MDGLCVKILENYEIDVISIKKTKGYYVINTAQASYVLRKTSDSEERALLRYQIQETLLKNDFLDIEKIYKTRDNNLFVSEDGQKYILNDYIMGREADFDDIDDLSKILCKLAKFHQSAKSLDIVPKQFYADDLNARLTKMLSELSAFRKKITTSKSLSNFDLLFLKNYEYYEKKISTSAMLLDKANYPKKLEEAYSENSICHNNLKKETLMIKDNEVSIAMLSGISVDHFSADIAMIINKYMKYSSNRQINILDIIDMYSNAGNNKLDADDLNIVLARLLIPTVFLGASKEYYMKKRSWAPSVLTADLEQEINSRETFLEYIEPLVALSRP